MQTAGTALQLSGSFITLCGLLWAWHKASGRINQWRAAIVIRLAQLRRNIAVRLQGIPSHQASANLSVQVQGSAGATVTRHGTPEERLERLEDDHNTVLNMLREQESRLRIEIDQAIADSLDTVQAECNAVRLRDIYPAVFGVAVSIFGYVCQLIG